MKKKSKDLKNKQKLRNKSSILKSILVVINTLGRAGAEVALMGLLKAIGPEYDIDLYVITAQGEMVDELPEYVHVLNDMSTYSKEPIHSVAGAKALKKQVIRALFTKGMIIKNLGYLVRETVLMLSRCISSEANAQKGFKMDKLLWKSLSDASQVNNKHYDMAIAYLEGGSTYYVADHINADKKVGFVHISYEAAGYTKSLDHGVYDKLDRVYCVSDESAAAYKKFYPEHAAKVMVFHNIIDVKRIKDLAAQNAQWEGENPEEQMDGTRGDGQNVTRLLTVGRLNEQKGYDYAIKALALLKKQGIQVRWYALGDGDKRDELVELAKSLDVEDDFVILGIKENPYPYFKECDIYVQPSRFEGKCISMQEAMVLGKPIVATACSGNVEAIENEVNGLLVEVDEVAIADGIKRLIEDSQLRQRLADTAAQIDLGYEGELAQLLALIEG